jgi:hypothetical protein
VFIMRSFKEVNIRPNKIKVIPSRKLLSSSILGLLFGFSSSIVAIFIQIWFTIEKLPIYEISLVYMGSSIAGIASSFLTDRMKENTLLKFVTLISLSAIEGILTFIIYFPSPISIIAYLMSGLISPIILTARNVMSTTALRKLNEIENGFALLSTFSMIGQVFGILGEGILFTLGDYIIPFAIGSSLGFVTTVVYLALYERITKT